MRLSSLTPEDFYVLLQKIRGVYAFGDPAKHLIPDTGVFSFMEHCSKRIGDTYFRTPRTTITAFINLIVVLVLSALGLQLPLPAGVVGHEGSTVLVCLNGLRLLAYRR